MTRYNDDKLLINKLKRGDVLSFDRIFNKYNRKVYYFALSYLKNREESEDVLQEVFMNLWKNRNQINEYYVFSKYLFRITYNAICKKFRKQSADRRQIKKILKNIIQEDNSTEIDIEYKSFLETVNTFVKNMPSRQKEIFLLSLNERLSSEQIALQLNISKKTVDNYKGIVKTSLKKFLSKENILPLIFFGVFIK